MSGFESALKAGKIIKVVFTKKDGDTRILIGTTNMDRIPKVDHPRATDRAQPTGVRRVYDLEIGEWRSVPLDRIKEWKETEYEMA
jgi:hypothetical protein